MKNDGGPAFPSDPDYVTSWEGTQQVTRTIPRDGLTKREYYAGQAMMGLLAKYGEGDISRTSENAVKHADALIAELAKEE